MDLIEKLKTVSLLALKSRLHRLRRIPIKILLPYYLARTDTVRRVLAPTFFGRQMLVILPEAISARIWQYTFFEDDVCFYLLRILRAGDTFIDVGGHFGFFSMLGRELVGVNGTVITFEPMPETRAVLQENMDLNAAPARHYLIPAAAGSAPGRLTFKDFGIVGSAFATPGVSRGPARNLAGLVEVEVKTIDEVSIELGMKDCRLIKIDAENAELEVILGAMSTLKDHRPAIVVEAGDLDGGQCATRRVVDHLMAHGYLPFEFHQWSIRPHRVLDHYGYQNLLMIHSDRMAECLKSLN